MHLLDCDSLPIQPSLHPSRPNNQGMQYRSISSYWAKKREKKNLEFGDVASICLPTWEKERSRPAGGDDARARTLLSVAVVE
ncbi:hypothetical protein B296_00045282 [Ensete ventricosum]|uniref:Uncharacterized protein n=1 Tax=Ensete ventricosum TaxID=4639 RepID=A0A426YW90_ENSVE|nr:hypothetical protein B296_00045282 [Ensete ventricosum]